MKQWLRSWLVFLVRDLFHGITVALRPFLGPRGICIYPLTCTMYAHHVLEKENLPKALLLIAKRVVSCNPLTALLYRLKR